MGFRYVETSTRTREGVNELVSAMLPELIAFLLRDKRDGFRAHEVYRRCDGHGNTLARIRDTEWNAFGRCTPIECESPLFEKRKRNGERKSLHF
jgi:hypothetical protein